MVDNKLEQIEESMNLTIEGLGFKINLNDWIVSIAGKTHR